MVRSGKHENHLHNYYEQLKQHRLVIFISFHLVGFLPFQEMVDAT